MSERPTLSLRGPSERQAAAAPRRSWNVSETRRERLKEMARARRRHPSDAQKALWTRLANQKLGGFKFHRQVVVGSTIADFACPARWLVVDIAGGANAEVLAIQDRKLADVGIRVLRFSESQVLTDIEAVLAAILEQLKQPFDRRAERAANAAGRSRNDRNAAALQAEDEALFATDPEADAETDTEMDADDRAHTNETDSDNAADR